MKPRVKAGTSKSAAAVAIYALHDPRTGEARYIGKALNPEKRLLAHLNSKTHLPVAHWVRKLRRLGMKPEMRIIEWVPIAEWEAAERRWIATHRAKTDRLLNLAAGGAGPGRQEGWATRNPGVIAAEMLDRIKSFDVWCAERKRTGCEQLFYWNAVRILEGMRDAPVESHDIYERNPVAWTPGAVMKVTVRGSECL